MKDNVPSDYRYYNLFSELVGIIRKLRSPEGCPWDREQNLYSMKNHLLEEAYEVIDALDNRDIGNIKEELGDLLLHIVIHSVIAEEEGHFKLDDVISNISEKLIRRHPHVFGDTKVKSTDEVMKNWENIKADEGKTRDSIFDGIPKNLPALQKSYKLQKRAAKVGFDWKNSEDCFEKVEEEYQELKDAISYGGKDSVKHELGDVIFALVNLGRFLDVDPDEEVRNVNNRFIKRFGYIENRLRNHNLSLEDTSLQEMEELWKQAKEHFNNS